MKALILTDGNINSSAGDANAKVVANALWALDIPSQFLRAEPIAQDVPRVSDINQMILDDVIDMVFIPRYAGVAIDNYERFMNGSVNCAVFVVGVSSSGPEIKGTQVNRADSEITWSTNQIIRTGHNHVTTARRHLLGGVSGDEETVALVTGLYDGDGAAGTPVFMWRYTPDSTATTSNKSGPNYIFNSTANSNAVYPVHLMFQEAIEVGAINKPSRKAPFILSLDHANDAGEPIALGAGGWQENPIPLNTLAAVLRNRNATRMYSSIEEDWVNNVNGTTTGALKTNLQNAGDVISYSALHNHGNIHLTQIGTFGDPLSEPDETQQSKTFIDDHFNSTLQAISDIGLKSLIDYCHFANDAGGSHVWELATPETNKQADPDGNVPKKGYGMKVGRISKGTASWPTNVLAPEVPNVGYHWLSESVNYRGIEMIMGSDAGQQTTLGNRIVSISAIGTGTNPVITTNTGAGHNGAVGAQVYIAGTDSTPDIDGWHIIDTVIDATNFTIIADDEVTVVGTTGTATNYSKSVNDVTEKMMQGMNSGFFTFLHAEDFEDVKWRFDNVEPLGTITTSSGGTLNVMYGIDAIDIMGQYCDSCADVTQFGADLLTYFPRTAINLNTPHFLEAPLFTFTIN